MGNFYTDTIKNDPRYTSEERCDDMALLEPHFRAKVEAIIAGAAAEGRSLMVYETFRSEARQQQLYQQGATQLKQVGVHGFGLAADIVIRDHNGDPSWDSDFKFLQPLAKENKVIWGGDWGNPEVHHSFVDEDHVQWCSINHQPALFDGSWYPSPEYDPYP